MTKEQQRIAIAEWKDPNWKNSLSNIEQEHFERTGQIPLGANVPNYPEDLNAMHGAWTKLTFEQDEPYCRNLHKVCCPDNSCRHPWDCSFTINATASQRSEALCRTLWPERFETTKGEV